jgi:hypothetical protein
VAKNATQDDTVGGIHSSPTGSNFVRKRPQIPRSVNGYSICLMAISKIVTVRFNHRERESWTNGPEKAFTMRKALLSSRLHTRLCPGELNPPEFGRRSALLSAMAWCIVTKLSELKDLGR